MKLISSKNIHFWPSYDVQKQCTCPYFDIRFLGQLGFTFLWGLRDYYISICGEKFKL